MILGRKIKILRKEKRMPGTMKNILRAKRKKKRVILMMKMMFLRKKMS